MAHPSLSTGMQIMVFFSDDEESVDVGTATVSMPRSRKEWARCLQVAADQIVVRMMKDYSMLSIGQAVLVEMFPVEMVQLADAPADDDDDDANLFNGLLFDWRTEPSIGDTHGK